MPKIAIDIVLLPDEKTQKICREVNSNIGGKLDFTNTGKTPHISLLMGVVEVSELEKISQKLKEISKNFSEMYFVGKLRKYTIGNTGETGYSYELEENIEILKLFSQIVENIRPELEYENISPDMFFQPEEVEEQSCIWVKGFKNRTVEEYSSHITLGIGELSGEKPEKIEFRASELAIYQLGNYCTCENKLFELELN